MTATMKTENDPLWRYLSDPTPKTFAAVVSVHQMPVLEIAYHVVGDLAAAEDICQEVFWRLIVRRPRVSAIQSPRSYISRMAYNRALNWKRGEHRREAKEKAAAKKENPNDFQEVSPEELRDAVNALPETFRIPLYLHFFQGLNQTEIGYVLKCHRHTVGKRITDAKRMLKKCLGAGYLAALMSWGREAGAHIVPGSDVTSRIMSFSGSARKRGIAITVNSIFMAIFVIAFLGMVVGIPFYVMEKEEEALTAELDKPLEPGKKGVVGKGALKKVLRKEYGSINSLEGEKNGGNEDIPVQMTSSKKEQSVENESAEVTHKNVTHDDQPPALLRTVEDINSQVIVVNGEKPHDGFGRILASLGDINGDGYPDVAFSAVARQASREHVSYILFGSADLPDELDFNKWHEWGVKIHGGMGKRQLRPRGGIGDLDNDGFDDVVFRSIVPSASNDSGDACILFGSADLPEEIHLDDFSGVRVCRIKPDKQVKTVLPVHALSRFASGDVDGDGLLDLICGAPASYRYHYPEEEGLVYVIFGRPSFPEEIDLSEARPKNKVCRISTEKGAFSYSAPERFGFNVRSGFDFNDDGLDDIAVSAPGPFYPDRVRGKDVGEIIVIFGRKQWPQEFSIADSEEDQVFRAFSEEDTQVLVGNNGLECVEDVTSDDRADILATKSGIDRLAGTYLISGKDIVPGDYRLEDVKTTFFAVSSRAQIRGACMGDWDGDGTKDIIFGGPLADLKMADRTRSGAVFIVPCQKTYPEVVYIDDRDSGSVVIAGQSYLSRFGHTVAPCDLNNDGLCDYVVSAPGPVKLGMPNCESMGRLYVLPGGMDLWGPLRGEYFSPKVSDLTGGGVLIVGGTGFDETTEVYLGERKLKIVDRPDTRNLYAEIPCAHKSGALPVEIRRGNEIHVFQQRFRYYQGNFRRAVKILDVNAAACVIEEPGAEGPAGFKLQRYDYRCGGRGDVTGDGLSDVLFKYVMTLPAKKGSSKKKSTLLLAQGRDTTTEVSVVDSDRRKPERPPSPNEVFLLHGCRSLPEKISTRSVGKIGTVFYSAEKNDLFGDTAIIVGDMTGDGTNEVVISAFCSGKAYLIHGGDMPLGRVSVQDLVDRGKCTVIEDWPRLSVGLFFLAPAGDMNDDGFHDLVMISHSKSDGDARIWGHIILVLGRRRIPKSISVKTCPMRHWHVPGRLQELRRAMSLGDIDGDGFDDVACGPFFLFGRKDFSLEKDLVEELDQGTASVLIRMPLLKAGNKTDQLTKPPMWYCHVNGIGDQNGDGRDDIGVVCGEWEKGKPIIGKTRLSIIYGRPREEFRRLWDVSKPDMFDVNFTTSRGYNSNPHITHGGHDFNGDGLEDFLLTDDQPSGSVAPSRAIVMFGGDLERKQGFFDELTCCFELIKKNRPRVNDFYDTFPTRFEFAGDVNGDGHEDLITADSGKVYVFFNPLGGIVASK